PRDHDPHSDAPPTHVRSTSQPLHHATPTLMPSAPLFPSEGQTRHYTFSTTDPGVDTFSVQATSGGSVGTVSNLAFDPATGAGSLDGESRRVKSSRYVIV